MTHLRIEQSTGSIEEVSASIISKLYELVYAGLDTSSNLQGRLHTPVSYRTEVQYLTTNYPELYITSDDYAIPFEDPNMLSYLNSIGVGSNGMITESLAAAATVVANSANTTVTKFNELKYFTGITGSRGGFNGNGTGNILFNDWTALEEVDISNFTSLGHKHTYGWSDTFYGCTSLKRVTASNKLTLIGHCAFRNCSNLEDITGLSGEIELACTAFLECSKLKNSNFTNVLFLVGGHDNDGRGFNNCTALTSLLISLNSTEIPLGLFWGCSNLTSVTGLQNITEVKSYAFNNCSKLSSIDIDWTKITKIGGESFRNCELLPITSLNCTSLLILDGSNIFRNCKLLQSITSLGTITTIPQASFYGCTGLTSVTLPSTLTTLGSEAFYGCSSLASIDLSNITTINKGVFHDCTNLATLTGLSSIELSGDGEHFYNCSNLVFPNNFSVLNSNNTIGSYSFYQCHGLTSITLASNITTLKGACFSGCSGLTAVNNSENITTFDGNAVFYGCSSLTELNLSNLSLNGPSDRCKNSFGGCTNLEKVILGDCVGLGNNWTGNDMWRPHFMNCTSLHTVDVKSLQIVPSSNNANTFYNCPAMQNFIIRSSVVPSVQDNGNVYISAFGGSNVKIYVPDAAVNDYKNATGWSNVASYIYPLSLYQP